MSTLNLPRQSILLLSWLFARLMKKIQENQQIEK